MINEGYKKAQRLIKEGASTIQDTLVELMVDIKKNHPDLVHREVMDLFKAEVEKFLQFHDIDRIELPRKSHRLTGDKFPVMKVPYGGKKPGSIP
jgi:hypothetical protein